MNCLELSDIDPADYAGWPTETAELRSVCKDYQHGVTTENTSLTWKGLRLLVFTSHDPRCCPHERDASMSCQVSYSLVHVGCSANGGAAKVSYYEMLKLLRDHAPVWKDIFMKMLARMVLCDRTPRPIPLLVSSKWYIAIDASRDEEGIHGFPRTVPVQWLSRLVQLIEDVLTMYPFDYLAHTESNIDDFIGRRDHVNKIAPIVTRLDLRFVQVDNDASKDEEGRTTAAPEKSKTLAITSGWHLTEEGDRVSGITFCLEWEWTLTVSLSEFRDAYPRCMTMINDCFKGAALARKE